MPTTRHAEPRARPKRLKRPFGRRDLTRRRLGPGLVVLLVLIALAGPSRANADLALKPITSDFDAEFAAAADAIETDRREEGLRTLESIRARSALVPAWRARVGILLATDALSRRDYAAAIRELEAAPAAAIGLEPYRQQLLGRAYAASGRPADAIIAWRAAWETDEPFAARAASGRALAGALARQGSAREAEEVMARVATLGASGDARADVTETIRLALSAGDHERARRAARELVLLGADPASAAVFARGLAHEELARLSAADRGRLGRRLVSTGQPAQAGQTSRGIRLLRQDPPSAWPADERAANLLALARGLESSHDARGAAAVLARVPEDGSPADYEARLLRADASLTLIRRRRTVPLTASDPLYLVARRAFLPLCVPPAPASVRAAARERVIRLAGEADLFDDGLEQARGMAADSPGTVAGFESLWKLAWERFRARDWATSRQRMEALAGVYSDVGRQRRLVYWRARILSEEGRSAEASPLYESLATADPPDIYATFSRQRLAKAPASRPATVSDPTTATATYRRTDELLRLRLFEDAVAEARALPPSRGRELRLAEAEFALGRFPAAAAAVKRAFPEIGTAGEARVPDGWRRLFYPIELGGFLATNARQFRLDPAVLRGLVRQESVFDAEAKSRAGALGLTQLMPATARGLSKSVLRVRYRRAFLYDPSMNSRLGAAYLRSLYDRFSDNPMWALAAYNGGPTRMARVLRENAGLPDDEIFESHPVYETRDYVRRVMLYAESYRALYPG
jgi:soluble lytic murein transglycosylase-like protein